MSLDHRLWLNLEAHGLTQQHLELLLRILEVQRSGHLAWHFAHGQLDHIDVRVVVPSRAGAMRQVEEAMGQGRPCQEH